MPALRGVIVDWGGVLTLPLAAAVSAWLEADLIEPIRYRAVMRPWIADSRDLSRTDNPVHLLERGECDPAEFERQLAEQLVRTDGGAVPAEGLLRRMFAAMLPVPAMYDMLRALRTAGIRTCLLSNSWGANEYPREVFPELFDAWVISSEVRMRKPEPGIFLHAAGLLGLPPEECVFIDDIEANVRAATSLGMVGVHHIEAPRTIARLAGLLGLPLNGAESSPDEQTA